MKFLSETGILLNQQQDSIHVFPGKLHVDFPISLLLSLHKKSPGYIYAMAHSHPPHYPDMSHEDETTLQAWTLAVYPFPMRMITTTLEKDYPEAAKPFSVFRTTCYLGMLETPEEWEERKRETPRKFSWITEYTREIPYPLDRFYEQTLSRWEKILISKSYE